jgi:hypothetical protein
MNTAVTKLPRVVRAILLLRAIRTQAKPVDQPFSRQESPALDYTRTLPPPEILPRVPLLTVTYLENRSLSPASLWAA